ncbi:MAG: cytochrome c oxidase subunit I [Legionellales bacterium]|nr:cytochrome c oxidase subunit I [Legionellales bacterium]OUX66481.1 MAG: cytochrome c oxidase subunit I [Gammaproteobacteria bacterium TMED281]
MADEAPTGLMRWVTTTNHKDIGTLYLLFSLAMFFVSGAMALVIRTELYRPDLMFVSPLFYNQLVTSHGLIMIFGAIMPALAGYANWQIPLMIGAADMAFPRLNNWSFWLLPFAMLLLVSPYFMGGPAPDMGWTFYAPLSTTYGPPGTDAMIFAIHMLGISSILASINIIATILNLRAPGMSLWNMPIFVWSWLITAFLILAIMPVLAGTVTMMLTDRHFGTSFFNAAGGGSPLLFEHLFWFFGHPEVYVLALPVFGIISEIIPAFSRKPLFGATSMIYAIIAIAVMSFIVWVHHMFTTGVYLSTQLFFMYTTMIVAVPTGVKVFNWIATMYKGSITLEPPMMFAVGFVFLFTIGGLTGVMLAIVPADYQYHATYFVVGHFHYVIVSGLYFGLVAGAYYWVPKWTGRMYNFKIAAMHFWLSLISSNITFWPMLLVGLAGMPRRIPDYNLQFTDFNQLATMGAFAFGISQILFVVAMRQCIFGKKKLGQIIWDGAKGLEWTLPTPLPYHTFSKPPKVKGKTYV